jgi:hypothetical protein
MMLPAKCRFESLAAFAPSVETWQDIVQRSDPLGEVVARGRRGRRK